MKTEMFPNLPNHPKPDSWGITTEDFPWSEASNINVIQNQVLMNIMFQQTA